MGFPALRSPRFQNTGANPGVDVVTVTPATLVRHKTVGLAVTPSSVTVTPPTLIRFKTVATANTTVLGRVKVRIGGGWAVKPLKVRVGAAWVANKPAKKHSGGGWS